MKLPKEIKRHYGRITVIHQVENNKHNKEQYYCICECGQVRLITGEQLREGCKAIKSCGCLDRDLIYLSKSELNINSGYLYQQIAFNNLIRERDGERCRKCNKTQEQEFDARNEKLHTHHKDFNKSNNKPENVITLCCSCHLKLHGRPPEFHCIQHSKAYKYSKMELRDEELLQLALDVAYT